MRTAKQKVVMGTKVIVPFNYGKSTVELEAGTEDEAKFVSTLKYLTWVPKIKVYRAADPVTNKIVNVNKIVTKFRAGDYIPKS